MFRVRRVCHKVCDARQSSPHFPLLLTFAIVRGLWISKWTDTCLLVACSFLGDSIPCTGVLVVLCATRSSIHFIRKAGWCRFVHWHWRMDTLHSCLCGSDELRESDSWRWPLAGGGSGSAGIVNAFNTSSPSSHASQVTGDEPPRERSATIVSETHRRRARHCRRRDARRDASRPT